ncbi:hypothetical protein V6N12_027996 [Hibiscus sabdariffa]|uniref:Cyclopropane-fatty-acyl-phospholipid synthase n=1 Tax=Hibiscus sabdariffa TaxID=183260 RepID=A0ABR2F4I2_9ROSI
MMDFFESLGIDMEPSDVSFSVSLDEGNGFEWGSRNGFSSLFAQKSNLFSPCFWQMLREICKFKNDVTSYLEPLESNPDISRNETLGQFLTSKGYSELFQEAYLVPVCGSIWSSPTERVMDLSAFSILSFLRNHHLLQLFGRPQWMTVRWRSQHYINKIREELESRGCQIRTGCEVNSVLTDAEGCTVLCGDDSQESYQGCIMAVHAPDALRLLGNQATYDESTVLGAFQYIYRQESMCDILAQCASGSFGTEFYVLLFQTVVSCYTGMNLGETSLPFLVTVDPDYTPQHTLLKWRKGHLLPSVAATKASLELDQIQGKRGIWFCGAYQGSGSHEDGLKAGMIAANGLLGKRCDIRSNPKHMVMTEADLGLADAYINGDFSFVDKKDGLLNLLMILISNRDLISYNSKLSKKRGWWTPLFFTAGLTSAKYFFKHVLRQNTLTQARRNISRHYDLSNDLFALFMDKTMAYSCPVFKTEDEDLKDAQERKFSLLIEKARIDSKHEILEIGCGWGGLAIEVFKRTGCKYTGITLSKEQLKYAEKKVKEAGLQENIIFQLCDYRQLPSTCKYDRIISCEMIEAVGHEYMEDFFGCCESVLAEDGLLVLQFTWIPEERYDGYRRSSDFIKEYIFPGGCLPCLTRVTTAMKAASRLCVEHVENIGLHYYQTLRYWRKNFLENQSKIHALGFDDKFIRTWEYYFDYCAAGFKTNTLGNYQVVFSRPGNVAALGNPFKGFPAAS